MNEYETLHWISKIEDLKTRLVHDNFRRGIVGPVKSGFNVLHAMQLRILRDMRID